VDDEDEDEEIEPRTDGGTVDPNLDHDPPFRTSLESDETVDLTLEMGPCCGNSLGEVEGTARLIEEIPETDPIHVT
jgi:hypothetical protein